MCLFTNLLVLELGQQRQVTSADLRLLVHHVKVPIFVKHIALVFITPQLSNNQQPFLSARSVTPPADRSAQGQIRAWEIKGGSYRGRQWKLRPLRAITICMCTHSPQTDPAYQSQPIQTNLLTSLTSSN